MRFGFLLPGIILILFGKPLMESVVSSKSPFQTCIPPVFVVKISKQDPDLKWRCFVCSWWTHRVGSALVAMKVKLSGVCRLLRTPLLFLEREATHCEVWVTGLPAHSMPGSLHSILGSHAHSIRSPTLDFVAGAVVWIDCHGRKLDFVATESMGAELGFLCSGGLTSR